MSTIEQVAVPVEPVRAPTWEPQHAHGSACYWDVRECRWVCLLIRS